MLCKFLISAITNVLCVLPMLSTELNVLKDEIAEAIALGCEHVQFDEPMWTESPEESAWAAGILAKLKRLVEASKML